jgi:hypothetical protein
MDMTSSDLSTVGLQEYVRDVTSSNLSMSLVSRNMSVTSNDLYTDLPPGIVRDVNSGELSRRVPY